MRNYDDFIDGLRQDVQIPDEVWSQYTETLEHIEQMSDQRKEVYHMRRNEKNKSRRMIKAAAVAGALVTATGIFSFANPVAAAKLPLIGHIFEHVAEDATFSGDYQNKTALPDARQEDAASAATGMTAAQNDSTHDAAQPSADAQAAPGGIFRAAANGITVTASEIYSDGYSVYLTAEITSDAGGFTDIPEHYTRRFEEKTSQSIHAMGTWHAGNAADTALSNSVFEGKAVDDHTFIGMLKLDAETLLTGDGRLCLELSELSYDSDIGPDREDITPANCITGTWKLDIPYSVDDRQCKELPVDKAAGGYRIEKVFVSPYQVIVFCDAPYTTLSPETYTREDFEAQWGKKNDEIAAAGDTPVTYEDMLDKKFYDYFETAIFNQDGQALSMQYGDDKKCIFAVQDLDLQTLHIYLADESNELGLIKAANEQEAKKLSILDAQITL